MYNTIIIGGGAAGLFIAANIQGGNNLILEGSKKLGQKILLTGGGMCNITNMDSSDEFLSRFGDKSKTNFLKPSLLNLSTDKTRDWLNSIGLELIIRDDGKVFPKSLKAQNVIDILYKKLTGNGVRIKYNAKVLEIKKTDIGFEIKTCKETLLSKNIVLATGGKSFPETGSDGSGYLLAKSLNHRIIPPSPALSGLKISNYEFKSLSGNSVKSSSIDFYRENETKRYLTANGDILFTHQGLSGPGILNNSRNIKNGDILKISLIPCNNKEEKREEILNKINSSGKTSLKKILKELGLTTSMITLLGDILKIDITEQGKSLNKKVKNRLVSNLLNFNFKVGSKIGFNAAMVTAGGVDISEINRKTMESKLVPGLFFAGEVIDIDGDTGGYNIQAAFSTAKLVTDTIN